MVEPDDDEESPVLILPLSGITTILSVAPLGSSAIGISMAASNAKTHKPIMIAFFFTVILLSRFS
jgi:hypothetical protein